ncbi:MAG: hypothetical protein CVU50_04015 [Candidatus Cloacimonetes bacterium HGW-Cloacimonetes-3]|jgi:hypothetical protein|nr:MAG: hypothetical protein CVU50_04015 [Candidatus Cloacimonetes bacterium HGW-Cloacimonetes-3]
MFKKALLYLLLVLPLYTAAQNVPFVVSDKTRYSQSGIIGYTEIDSVRFRQLRLIQEFKLGKVKMGLDMDFLFNEDYKLRPDNWDNIEDILSKFYYVKYSDRKDNFYMHLGGFPGLTLGNGLIMQNYSNMQLYPALRNTGILVGVSPRLPFEPSFEVFSSNVVRNQILSLTVRCKPLPDSTVKVLDQLVLGFSAVTDRNQYNNLKYYTDESLIHLTQGLKSNSATVLGFSYNLPFFQTDKLTLHQYAELAHIAGHGTGFILPGISANWGIISTNLEYRVYGDEFVPAFFDRNYEENKATVYSDPQGIVTKEDKLDTVKATQGWNGSVQGKFYDRINARVAWANIFGKELKTGKSLWLNLGVESQYKRLEYFSLSYSKTGTEHMAIRKWNEPNTEIGGSVTVRVIKKRWFMTAQYSERYKDKSISAKGLSSSAVKRSVGVGVKYLVK